MIGCVLALVLILASAGMLTSVRAMLDIEFGWVQRQDASVLVAPEADDVGAQLRSLPGVTVVEPATIARVTVAAKGHTYPTSLTGLEPATVMHGFRTPDGTARTLPADGALAGAALADKLGVRVGDDMTVIPRQDPPARFAWPGWWTNRWALRCMPQTLSPNRSRMPDLTDTWFAWTKVSTAIECVPLPPGSPA